MSRFLALDWDQNQLHVVAATIRGGKVRVERAAVWTEGTTPTPADAESLGSVLRDRLKTAGIAPAPVLVSLARDRVILKELRFPAVPESEEANVVRFQAVKELTDAADDVIIDYVPISEKGAPEQRAMALIARKELVSTYQTLCHAAGLRLAAVAPRPFGTAAAARRAMAGGGALTPKPEPADAAVALITVGDKWAEFCVLRGETLVLARTLTLGPMLAGEIRRNLTVYNGQNAQRPVQAVYLSNGPNSELRQRLGSLIEVPIYPFDPFAGAEIEVPGNPGGFAGAAGLLFAQGERSKLPINFLDPRKPTLQANPYARRLLVAAALVIMIFTALFFTSRVVIAGLERDAQELEEQKADLDKQLTAAKQEGLLFRGLEDNWVSVVWPDELYDLTDRVADVNILRVTSLNGLPISRNTKSLYTSELKIEGEILDPKQGRKPLDQLIDRFKADNLYYAIEGLPYVDERLRFKFTVKIKRRPPDKFTRRIPNDL